MRFEKKLKSRWTRV